MWPNSQETADLVTLTKSLIENFIFCAVYIRHKRTIHLVKFPVRVRITG